MSLPAPWNHLESSLQNLQNFDLGAQKLSDFFKGKEERQSPDELLEIFFHAKPPQKMVERLLFFLFDIGVPDRQIGSRALQAHRLNRLWMRARRNSQIGEVESELLQRTKNIFTQEPEQILTELIEARKNFLRLIDGEQLNDSERGLLISLIGAEAEALRYRVNWISEHTDPYNMATMARILPRLRIYDEAVQEGMDLAKRQAKGEPVGLKILTFEAHMKDHSFDKWLKKVSHSKALERLGQLIKMQRIKKIPTLDLIAMTTISRWTWDVVGAKAEPMDWIQKAMESYSEGEFSIEAGDASRILGPALSGSGAKVIGTCITGNFGLRSFPNWVGKDLLTKNYHKAEDEGTVDIKSVITQNISRDSIIEALLNNPKVFQTPGLVAFIAATSRSLAILSKIAKSRDLVAGYANRDVPLALLMSPCNIPISLLRPIINVRNIPLIELRNMARAKAGIRREIRDECEAYLKARG